MRTRRTRWRLGAAVTAFLCGSACGEESSPHASVWTPVLQWAGSVLPTRVMVLKANRAPLVAGLDEEEFPCTSLSGPSCLWGVQSQPQMWTRGRTVQVAPEPPDQGQGAASSVGEAHGSILDGASSVFVLPATALAFHGLLTGGGDWLVLFLRDEATCGPACGQAVTAVHAAAPELSVSGVRFVAVQCHEPAFLATCRRHGVTDVPELRLYFGSTQLSVLFDAGVYRTSRLRTKPTEDDTSSTTSDEDAATTTQVGDDADQGGDGGDASDARGHVWDSASVVAFHRAHSTPLARALLTEARTLLRDWLGDGDTTPWSGVEGEEDGEADNKGDAAAATATSSSDDGDGEGDGDEAGPERHSLPLRQAVQDALSTRLDDGRVPRGMGDGASRSNSVAEFRKHMEGLLKEHHREAAARAGGGSRHSAGAEEPPNGISRSLPSKPRRKLHLVNTRGVACDALWVDFQGVERPFARIQPGRTATLSTFTSHLWRIRDAQSGGHVAFVLVTGRQGGGAPAEGDVLRYVIT